MTKSETIGAKIAFDLPWPPSELSPNKRQHWGRLAKAKRIFRRACHLSVLEQRVGGLCGERFALTYEFAPPDARCRDRDNLVAAMKSGIDGVCDALGIDDKLFVSVTAVDGARTKGGSVRVKIEALA